ncbi:MAG: ABC transporter permease [Planctomycetes bacterium]|nr:ABC transporter permease [Planctomycetota bacterium]
MASNLDFLLHQSVALATPIALAAVGETLIECSGVFHLCLEGTMLTGALAGTLGASYFGSASAGVACAVAAACVFELLFAAAVLWWHASEVIAGTAMNLLAAGATAVLWRSTLGLAGTRREIPTFQEIPIPGLASIPSVGSLLFTHHAITYFTIFAAAAVWLYLTKTAGGLRLRACGESPSAAAAIGLNPRRIRFMAILCGGALAGVAGASLSLAEAGTFVEDMTSGRGFIALALVIFGAHHPIGAALSALLFGGALAVQYQLQASGVQAIPPEFFRSLPYFLSLLVLALPVARRAPASLGKGL